MTEIELGEHELEQEHLKSQRIPGIGFMLGAMAACGAVTFTNPWEVVKIRLQLQGELQRKNMLSKEHKLYRNVGQAFLKIGEVEGLRGLQKGLMPAYMYQILMNGVRFGGYDPVKAVYTKFMAPEYYAEGKPYHLANILAGATSGMVGAALGSPFFMVKTRLQSYSKTLAVGTQHEYRGTVDALKSIIKNNGAHGLLNGMQAATLRTGVGSAVQLSTYDKARSYYISRFGIPDNVAADFGASLTSGFFVCVFMNPFDTVTTRMYNQGVDAKTGKGLFYSSPFDCFVKTVKSEGFAGLYKGFWAHYLRVGPHTILCFVFLEQLKRRARANGWM